MIEGRFIDIEGFGSIIKRTVYRLHKKGLYILYGENGAGKSTIPNALTWCIYGRTLKNNTQIEPWEQTKGNEYEETKVRFFFKLNNQGVLIVRTLNRLYAYIEGKPIKHKRKKDVQKWIIEKIGYSFELFKASIVFGQKLRRLMSEDTQTKKRILEETFDTLFINKARDEVSNRLFKLEHQIKLINEVHQGLLSKLQLIKEQIKYTEEVIKEQEQKAKQKLFALMQERKLLENKIFNQNLLDKYWLKKVRKVKKIAKYYEGRVDLNLANNLFRTEMKQASLRDDLDRSYNNFTSLKDQKKNVPRKCDKCGQRLDKDTVMQYISSIIKQEHEEKQKMDKYNKELSEIDIQLQSLKKRQEHNEKFKLKYYTHKNKTDHYRRKRLEDQNETKILKSQEDSVAKQIKEIEETPVENKQQENKQNLLVTLKKLKQDLVKAKKDLVENNKKQENYKWMLQDPLSNSGLKVFIFNTMLQNINQALKKYIPYIGYLITLKMDLDSAHKNLEILIYDGKYKKEYESLSGGQQQLIDVSLLLGLNDAITINKPISFLFLDEVFESLTQTNIEKIEQIIWKKAQEKSLHLITHTESFSGYPKIHFTLNKKGQTIIIT